MSEQIVVFFDALGRTIIGVSAGEDDGTIQVQNPAVLHAGLNNEGKIQVNLIPAFFREFLTDWNNALVFSYHKHQITREVNSNTLDPKLIAQYTSMWVARPPREEVKKIVRELKPTEEAKPVERLNLFSEVTSPDTTVVPTGPVGPS